jgi:glycosyltransferase involved in cell wall biosynthesis
MEQNDFPLVSIVTPSYNQGQFIEDTILSVLGQGYPRIEYWVIDGGSTDSTLEVLKKYQGKIHWISEPDQGQADAINKGWARCQGDLFTWINSDDYYVEGAIQTIVDEFRKSPDTGLVYGDLDIVCETKEYLQKAIIEPFSFERFLFGNILGQPNVFIAAWVLKKAGMLNAKYRYALDYDLWMRTAPFYATKHIAQKIAEFRVHKDCKTSKDLGRFSLEYLSILMDLKNSGLVTPANRKIYRKAIAYQYSNIGFCFANEGDYRKAVGYFLKAIFYNPLYLANRGVMVSLLGGVLGNFPYSILRRLFGKENKTDVSAFNLSYPIIPGAKF